MIQQSMLHIDTSGRGTTDITDAIAQVVLKANVITGLCHLFLHEVTDWVGSPVANTRGIENGFARAVLPDPVRLWPRGLRADKRTLGGGRPAPDCDHDAAARRASRPDTG